MRRANTGRGADDEAGGWLGPRKRMSEIELRPVVVENLGQRLGQRCFATTIHIFQSLLYVFYTHADGRVGFA